MSELSLSYAKLTPPAPGELTEVASGVYWIRMPVPFHPKHINVYLLQDADGWYLVDTGIGSAETKTLWQTITQCMMSTKPLLGVIATHLHPDHLGLAGWLCDQYRAKFYITQREYLTARALFHGNTREDNWELIQFYHRCGLNAEQSQEFIANTGSLAKITAPLPLSYQRLNEGQTLSIGRLHWQVLIGYGHSPEHACLYCKELDILLSGDQILPKISPNISVQSLEPDHSPLTEYLESMAQFFDLPETCLVLPSHGDPFYGLHQRLTQLQDGHQKDLSRLLEACDKPLLAIDSIDVIYQRELKGIQFRLAMGEALAHLNHLWQQGLITRQYDEQGRYVYQRR